MDITFICSAVDFHALDKVQLTSRLHKGNVRILTDMVELDKEQQTLANTIPVHHLFLINRFQHRRHSRFAHVWRNIVKIICIPIQVVMIKKFHKNYPNETFHALTMYYMLLCYLSRIPFIGTPQGCEIINRPNKSFLYKIIATKVLKKAKTVIVDSRRMQSRVFSLAKVKSLVLKNGFNTTSITKKEYCKKKIYTIVSIRILGDLYQIKEIVKARDCSKNQHSINFLYPDADHDYKVELFKETLHDDKDMGSLDRESLYSVLRQTLLVVSIPITDSSPRSVYESIFAGACVAATRQDYMDEIPECMKRRIYTVDLDNVFWMDEALNFAQKESNRPYIPSQEALDMCDENRTFYRLAEKVYRLS
tara:strand:- start:197 stop:1285 length:1089 start_codon:yes stop_codon:yes gene_type:complete